MRHTIVILHFFMLLVVTTSCMGDYMPDEKEQLVVEGWIDAGGAPKVFITKTLPMQFDYQSMSTLSQYIVKFATVTVSDGEKEVALESHANSNYNIPYFYTTDQLVGEVGKTYTLKISYKDHTLTSTTTIPEPVEVESFDILPIEGVDTLVNVSLTFKDNPDTKDYYQIFVNTSDASYDYLACFLGALNDEVLNNPVKVSVHNPIIKGDKSSNIAFNRNKPLSIKFAHIDEESYKFWSDFQTLTSLSRVQFLNATHSARSNIQGGLGYWCGYGSTVYNIDLR